MFHNVTITGNLGRDPEMRYMADGTAVTSFSVAVSDGYGDNKKTIWFKVTGWGKLAESSNRYLSTGDKVLVVGRLSADETGNPRLWQRKDGTVASSFEIRATEIIFLQTKKNGSDPTQPVENATQVVHTPIAEDEIPF